MTYVLLLWLAYSPTTLTPLGWYATLDACLDARRKDVQANIAAGMGGGATYICGEEK